MSCRIFRPSNTRLDFFNCQTRKCQSEVGLVEAVSFNWQCFHKLFHETQFYLLWQRWEYINKWLTESRRMLGSPGLRFYHSSHFLSTQCFFLGLQSHMQREQWVCGRWKTRILHFTSVFLVTCLSIH